MSSPFRVESLLSARLFVAPQLVEGRLYFISDLSGSLSLYAMDCTGSVPEPLLPRGVALQNPHLMDGQSFFVFPKLGKVLVMIDRDGDENYQPTFVPLDGGIPEPLFGERFQGQQLVCSHCDIEHNRAVFQLDPRRNPEQEAFLCDLESRQLTSLGSSIYGNYCVGASDDCSQIVLADGYTAGDETIYLWQKDGGPRRLLFGKPLEERGEGESVPLNSIQNCCFTAGDKALLFVTSLFDDRYGLGYLALAEPQNVRPVAVTGTVHSGAGEMVGLRHLDGERYLVSYNIDGASYAYEGRFDEAGLCLALDRALVGTGALKDGVLEHIDYEKASGDYALSFSTATSPTQIYTVSGDEAPVQRTRERILGIPVELLSPGEDAPYTSHDGLRISARLYLPAPALGFTGRRPVVFYIHGGPQGQERPDFAWFSMPLIQFFTLNGFAVFVPNVRGSTGYGLEYMKRVDHDWGGLDRLDHVAAFEHLRQDPRLDMERTGVMGRSYGGYMTLTQVGRHPDLWRAACDMFGPYNLLTFIDRLPEAWKTHFYLSIGHPDRDRPFIEERSPSTYLNQLACPLLVLQGRNDPRVVEAESHDLVEALRAQGKQVEYLVFENEGHDVIKFENKVRCYTEIVRFFSQYLQP